MFFSNKNHRLSDSKQKFSIRKYKLGTFSVLVGTLFYMTSISNIQAQEVKDSNISVEIKPKIDKNEEKEHKRENEIIKENNLLDDHSKQEDVKDKKDNFLQFQQELEAILQEGRLIASKVQGVEKNELEITLKEIEATIQEPKLLTQEIVASYKDKIHTLKKKSEASSELESKLNKAKELKEEIGSISSSIQYAYEPQEEEILKEAETMTASTKTVEEIDAFIAKLKQLRNKVANRMTREHSGKRDSRNGKVIKNSGESTFRGIKFTPLENIQDGKVVSNGNTNLTYFNSDSFWIKTQVKGEKFRHDSANTYYLVKKVTLSGKPFKDLSIIVSSGTGDRRASTTIDNINNPNVQAGILGNLGTNGIITPGNYQVVLTVNDTVSPGNNYNIIYNITIKPQSERNTVRDLTPTYVDDVRHLTEAEKTALIEKFKTEHPDVVNRAQHIDFDHAEISSDGRTMTVHFKDGLSTKTIQTNAQNDVDAKHSSLTTLVGDPHEFYKNPRNLVKSKTNHEVPQTARVTWKTPFDFSQPGTKNAVVTVSYDNGVTKDVTTPYTVLDFIGKQDKSINQNQSGELGDARSYIKLSNGTDPATDLTIRWKGGSSTVDTSAAGIQRKEIEILRGNTVMKTVTIPVAIVDNIKPTITAPDSVLLTRAEGLPGNISIDAQDNARGIGLKDTNPIAVESLANPLSYNPSTKRIELSGVIPNNFQRTQATIKAVDKNGNTATKTITFNVQTQTDKYNAVANPQKQTVSYDARPDAGLSVNKSGLPAGTTYTWATTPSTTTGPGEKAGVVTVTYPDTSKDTVNVTIAVRKLSDEHEPTGTKIVRNQNVPVTNNDLKAAVNVNNNGNSKVKSVTPVSSISTANAGMQTIRATVTYLDNTTDFVDIPLEVKDITAPTIQTPSDRQNWDLIALDRTLPSIRVAATDNPGGSGIKSTTVTGLPDFLVYDDATKTIKFKNGVQEVTKLPVGQNSKTYNATIQVTDNANNPSQRQVTITVKSMTTKYNATPNGQKQTVSYSATPDAGTSINKNGLPADTRYTWATAPSTTTGPGDKAGVVTVTYPDDSTDTVNVTVNVRRLADEYVPTGTKITREQNTAVTNDDLKDAVTISNNGNNKVKSVTPVGTISTAEFGNQTINATVTYLDDTTDSVTIPLEVRDVTKPTIQTPADRQNWDLIALDRTIPSIKVAATDNPGGSGIKSTTVTGLPNFLTYDEATKTIKFKNGVQEVTKLPEGTDVQPHNITIEVEDNAGNKTSTQVTITVKSMTTKYDATANPDKQTVSYGAIPDAGTSVNNSGLPEGTKYKWKTTPDTNTPGEKDGVVEVTYKDGSKDTVNVKVNVNKLSDEYNVTGAPIEVNQNNLVTNDDLKAKVTATPKEGNVSGTDKISTVVPKLLINTANYGDQNISATVTFKDGTTKDVTIPLKVKDVTNPTIQAPTNGQNWDLIAVEGQDPNIAVTSEDNAGGSGVKTTTVTGLPDFLVYDEATKTIKFKTGVTKVPSLPEGTDVQPHNITIEVEDNAGNKTSTQVTITVKSMTTKYDATPNPDKQTVSYGATPDAGTSVNTSGLPEGTSYAWKTTPDTNTPGEKDGVVEVTYKDGSKDTVNVKVNVNKLSDEYNVTGAPIEVNQNNLVTNDDLKAKVTATPKEGNVSGTDKISTVVPKLLINTANYGDQNISATVTFKDGTTKDVTIPLKVKDVTNPTIQAPTNGQNWDLIAVEGQDPNIAVTSEDNAGGSGVKTTTVTGLPDFLVYDEATKTIKFKTGVTKVPSLPEGTDVQPHNITIEVEDNAGNKTSTQVTITVKSMTTKYDATPNPDKQTVSYGATPDAGTSVNTSGLPEGTSYAWKTTPDTNTPGEKDGVVEVTYKDGSKDTVNVKVTVKEQKEMFNPTAKEPNQTVRHNEVPDPAKSINTNGLPEGTTYTWSEQPNTSTPGSKPGKVLITYPDHSTEEVPVTVEVTPQKDEYTPTGIPQTVDNGQVPNAEESVNKTGLPEGVTVTWKTTPEVNTPGSHPGVALVHYPDGTEDEVEVPVTVKEQKETFNPTAKEPNQTVRHNEVPDPAKSINTNGLPEGTTYTWSEQPNTSTPGSKPGKVLITYPDHSTEEVPVTVEVTPQKDEYTPTGIPQTVDNGQVPNAEESVNKTGLPEGVTVTWKTTPEVNTPGSHPGVALVHYPDGTEDEVEVPVTVRDSYDKGIPETPATQPEFTGGVNPPEAPTNEVPAYTDPIGSTGVDENGNLIEPPVVEAPEYSGGVNGEPETQLESPEFTGGVTPPEAPTNEVPAYTDPIGSTGVDENGNLIDPPVVEAPEFNGGVNGEPETQPEVLEFTGGVTPPEAPTNEVPEYTDPIGSTGVDENGNLIDPPVVETPEYSGGVNGELPDPTQLPKVKLITTKWIDENGNELKPADAKAPKVLGEANEAFEHGEIDGYEFVRTVVDENGEVVTHIFRKVTSTEVSQTNDKVEPKQIPDFTPVSTKESPSQPENEKITQKESQTILPNTGTANGLGIFSAAATSILLALGLMIPIKKEDEEEEEELS